MRLSECHRDRIHYAHGLCKSCYVSKRASGITFPPRAKKEVTCGHAGPHQGNGLCTKCYTRRHRSQLKPGCHPDRPYRSKGLCDACYIASSPSIRARQAQWRIENRERLYESASLAPYGLTSKDYVEILEIQGGVCAICRKVNRRERRLVLDHDHATGRVRGLLCDDCNLGLGRFKDSPETMVAAIAYLLGGDPSAVGRVVSESVSSMRSVALIV